MQIKTDNLKGKEIAQLLQEHHQDMRLHSPPESIHALDLQALQAPEITFWTLWKDHQLAGCGALKQLDPTHGEIKSMRTANAHRRQGVAAKMLQHVLDEAATRSYTRLSLETGSMDAFAPARTLYKKYGFTPCPPFADYTNDPNSAFMTKEL